MREQNVFSTISSEKRKKVTLYLIENGPCKVVDLHEHVGIPKGYCARLFKEVNKSGALDSYPEKDPPKVGRVPSFYYVKPDYIELIKEAMTFPQYCIANFAIPRRVQIFKYLLESKYTRKDIIEQINADIRLVPMVITMGIEAGYITDFGSYLAIAQDKRQIIERCIEISEHV